MFWPCAVEEKWQRLRQDSGLFLTACWQDVCCFGDAGLQILLQESFHYFKYKKNENILYEYADDVAPRHLTSALPLDYDSVAGGDKFGNIFITRLPGDISAQVSAAVATSAMLRVRRFLLQVVVLDSCRLPYRSKTIRREGSLRAPRGC